MDDALSTPIKSLGSDVPYVHGSLQVVRSVCDPLQNPREDFDHSFIMWVLPKEGTEGEHHPRQLMLLTQVEALNSARTHHLGVASVSVLMLSPNADVDVSDRESRNRFLETWGPSMAHVSWDYCTNHIRLLASGLPVPSVNLETTTPIPSLRFEDADDEMDQDGEETA